MAPPIPPKNRRAELPWITLSAVLLTALVALTVAFFRSGEEPGPIIRASVLSPEGVTYNTSVGGHLALSPDGTKLAFVAADSTGRQSLWVRSLDLMNATPLTGTDRAQYPFWSPDSRTIGFFADAKLKRIEAAGGPPLTVCDAPTGRGGSWNEAGVIVFAPSTTSPIHRVSAGGGESEAVTHLDSVRGEANHRWPWFLPDGIHFLYTSQTISRQVGVQEAVHVASLEGPESSILLYAPSNAVFANGYLLFVREQSLVAQPFDAGSREFLGDAFPVSNLVQYSQARSKGIFSASSNGMLVYQTGGNEDARMSWVDRAGTVVGQLVDRTPAYFCRLSPDGSRMVLDDYDAESRNTDLWLYDIRRDVTTRFTFDAADDVVPVWMPDGERVLFSSNRNGQYQVFEKAASGAEEETLVLSDDFEIYPTGVSPDGRYVMLTCRKQNSKWDLFFADLKGERKPVPYLTTEFNEWVGVISPDGRWVAYQSDESGKYEIYVRPFPSGGGKWQISTGGGQNPLWNHDGREIYFDSETGKFMRVSVQTSDQTLRTGIPEPLFDLTGREQVGIYDISPDGTRFVAEVAAIERSINPVTLVLNWQRDLERRLR